jgi:protoporphyrinogen oxidase
MVKDPKKTVWVGAEYFCNRGDGLWERSDSDFSELAAQELADIGMIDREDVLDSVIIRMPNTYPAYFGTYAHFNTIRTYVDGFENLFLIGRNGMHRYNNQDHSMLTAMQAVENIITGDRSKDAIWQVNVEETYHEEKENQAR